MFNQCFIVVALDLCKVTNSLQAKVGEQFGPPAPKTAKQLIAKRNQERVKSILLLVIPNEYLLKFHNVPDAKSLGAAIKLRFRGNDESKKMQRNVLKHQFENFTTTPNESLDKAYDRFQKIISQLKVHAAPISKEDINQKVYEDEMKRSLSSTSNSQNLAFLSSENTSSTNEVSTTSRNFGVNTAGGTSSTSQVSSTPGADEVVCSFFAQQTMSPPLDNEDLKGHFAKECKSGRNQGKRSYGDNGRRNAITNEPSSQALVAQDGLGGYDWSNDFDEPVNYALMAISSSSSSSSSNNEVRSSDEEITLANDRFSKADRYHVVPPPIIGNFLTPRADISFVGLDEYAIRKKIIKSKTDTSKPKTSETIGKTNEVNIEKPKSVHELVVPKPKINRDKVIIEDWNLDDDDDVSAIQTVSPVKTNETQTVRNLVDKIDFDFYAKKSQEPKLKTVVNTGQRVVKPVWDNAKGLINKFFSYNLKYPQARRTFILSGVLTMSGLVNPVRTNGKKIVHTISTAKPINTARPISTVRPGNSEIILQDHAVVDSGCSSHMTGNKAYLLDYKDYNGGFVAFGSDPKGVVLRAPRHNGVYSLDLKNTVPSRGITCLYANATTDMSKLWHRRLGHVNFKNINKLVKGHLVRGLPSKVFVNDHTCVACKKGKQHKASCKAKLARTIRNPLELLYMNLFRPISVESINKKKYCLVVTDDFNRFSWVFFLATKDETNEILYKFVTGLENQLNHKVKIIRSDHGTKFKNHVINEFCAKKGIKREFSMARTPHQNGVAERKNRTLIKAARTMLADSILPILFWAEAVNTACYINLIWQEVFDLDFLTNTMNYIPVSVENQVNVDAGTKEHYVVGSSKKDKEPTQEYILLLLHPHRPRISVEEVVPAAQEKPSESSPKDNDVHDSEDVAENEE
ncbi:putative ribonuclease H-like domain-containing protein [Tanacetum coccineum]